MRKLLFVMLALILLMVAAPAWAMVVDLDLTLSTGTASGFKIDGSSQEWLDVDTRVYDYDSAAQNVSGATDGFRLATITEWWVIANELLIDGYSVAEHDIVGGTGGGSSDPLIYYAYGLVVPEGGYGNGVIGYWSDQSPPSRAWISDSYSLTETKAWLVRDINPVPEPTTMFLLGAGLVGLAGYGRKRFKK